MDKRCPYENLYIYLVVGAVASEDEGLLGDFFLGNWVDADTSFLFFSRPAEEEVYRLIKKRENLILLEQYAMPYEQWQGGIIEGITVGRFSIVPPWVEGTAAAGKKRIILDPGVVFGNGLHPTTRHCLRALCDARKKPDFRKVVDVGTGTGVLAIAAALLGAKDILAVDLNPLCVRTALRNVQMNGLEGVIRVREKDALDIPYEEADLIIANIHYDVIEGLLKMRSFRQAPRVIISGLMRSQARLVREELKKYDIPLLGEWEDEMTWYTFLAGRGEGEDG
jgi:ribosomal protein L11 methyltransferase